MSNDMTYCPSIDCPRNTVCRRGHWPLDIEWKLSFTDFYKEQGDDCTAFWPIYARTEHET